MPKKQSALDSMMEKTEARPLSKERLDIVREAVRRTQKLEDEKEELQARVSAINTELNSLYHGELVDILDQSGIREIKIDMDGNRPPVMAKASPYYSANIAAGWPEERREEAFAYLKKIGHDDLIKTEFFTFLPRGKGSLAKSFSSLARKHKLESDVARTVHNQTLTAWLKEQVVKYKFIPDLEKIGGSVGRVVTIKPVKDRD